MKTTKEGLRWTLRTETEAAHQRLDDFVSQVDLSTRDGLSRYLHGNYIAHQALALHDHAFAGHMSRRIALLEQDAADLGLHLGMPERAPLVDSLDWDEAVGYRYVIAGSAMGSRLLARRHGKAADEDVRRAQRFVADEPLMAFWGDVLMELDALPDHGPQAMAAAAGANACFILFSQCFEVAFAEQRALVNA